MQLGGLAGLTALTMGLGEEKAMKERAARGAAIGGLDEASLPLTPAQAGELGVEPVGSANGRRAL